MANQVPKESKSLLKCLSTSPAVAAAAVSHAHSKHWNMERILSAALLGVIPVSLLLENQITDHILAVSLILHSYWGLKVIATDYIHGPTMPKLAVGLIASVSLLALVGLCYFNYTDIGLSKAIKKIWKL